MVIPVSVRQAARATLSERRGGLMRQFKRVQNGGMSPNAHALVEDINAPARAVVFNPARAKATIRNYTLCWRRFVEFCERNQFCALPAESSSVARFIRSMMHDYSPSYIRDHTRAISVAHGGNGFPSPSAASFAVGQAWHDVYEIRGRRQRQAAPINQPLRDAMIATKGNSLRDHRDRALIAVAYDTLMRRLELASLRVEDIVDNSKSPKQNSSILLRRSKTDQQGYGSPRFLAPGTIALIRKWLKAAGISSGLIFRHINYENVSRRMTGRGVAEVFKKRARQAGAPDELVDRIGGHSFRVGAAQDMASAHIPDGAIMQAGGWAMHRSMFKYIEHVRAGQSGAAQLAAKQNRIRPQVPRPVLSITISGAPNPAMVSQLLAAITPIADVKALNYRPGAAEINGKNSGRRKQPQKTSRRRK